MGKQSFLILTSSPLLKAEKYNISTIQDVYSQSILRWTESNQDDSLKKFETIWTKSQIIFQNISQTNF